MIYTVHTVHVLPMVHGSKGEETAKTMATPATNYESVSDYKINYEKNEKDSSWGIANVGNLPKVSRDGSVHVTDETFNAASHLCATLFSILGTVLLLTESSAQGNPWKIVSFSLYGTSLIFLFASSTLHHGITGKEYEPCLRTMDYAAIFPLIAGTFTPLTLVFYHDNSVGWAFCMTVWGLSLLCMILVAVYFEKTPKWVTMTLYVSLGWIGACFTYWLLPVLGVDGFALFILGGIIYSGGGYVFVCETPNPYPGVFGFHEIWHCAVVAAALCHWLLMYFYVLPY